ncbi:MAG TPA: SMC-Scp complex subunit ScpB [Chthoniobacterales bacterium]|jgi:segregation and condensation protein B
MSLKQVIEALLFASQKPLLPKEIVAALRGATDFSDEPEVVALATTKESEAAIALNELKTEYLHAGHSFQLIEQVNGWQLTTHPNYAVWVRQLFPEGKPSRLSPPALETLAIIAYRQPIMKADIEAVRGVAVDGMIQKLLEAGLVRIAGRAEVPGRPLLYESTQFFLEHFGLKTLDELPNSTELRHIKLPTAPVPAAPEAEQLPLNPEEK